METHLTLDIGNSRPHLGFFQQDRLLKVISIDEGKDINANLPVLVSQVGSKSPKLANTCIGFEQYFSNNKFLEMPVSYGKTLGQDRLYQAYYLFKQTNVYPLIINIDVGTFTTVDYIGQDGFRGGYILPGLELIKKSYQAGHMLPDINLDILHGNPTSLPQQTQEAMVDGIYNMYAGFFEKISKNFATPMLISLTGGRADKLHSVIKEIFPLTRINSDPHLIHKALTLIYQEVNK